MGRSIVKQPNGKFALFSSIVDDFVLVEATKEELIETLIEEQKQYIIESVEATLESMETNKRVYKQYPIKSWEEAKEDIERVHKRNIDLKLTDE